MFGATDGQDAVLSVGTLREVAIARVFGGARAFLPAGGSCGLRCTVERTVSGMDDPGIDMSPLVDAIVSLAQKDAPLNRLPGCWTIGDPEKGWFVAVNPHKEPMSAGKKADLDCGGFWVQWNGWPAGCLHVTGGGWIAAGEGANADTLLAWLHGQAVR